MADEVSSPADTVPVVSEASSTPSESGGTPTDSMPHTRWQKLRLVGLVILKRVRFIAILAGVGLFICKWDMVMNYWEKWTQPRSVASHELEPGREFYCPMDPQVVRSNYEPNGDVPKCPICGMPLSERKKVEKAELPAGITARVQLSPERIQLAGIKTTPVEYRPVAKQTKTVGYVTFDESRLSRIVSRVEGYVEKLYVDETFTVVHKGDPLAEIYSPELYSTARELVLATRAGGIGDLAAAARNKLLLLGVSQQEIDGIVASGQPSSRLVIRSPQAGYVVEKKIVVGSSVEARMTLLEVADLSTVWVEADVYEKDIPFLQVGQKVEATVEACPNRTFTGKLALIRPQLETATRTNRIRVKLDNSDHELRPGMFATVRINTPLETIEPFKSAAAKRRQIMLTASGGKKGTVPISRNGPEGASQKWGLSPFSAETAPTSEFLTVPERAVVDTGSMKVVYVEREPGMFEGVEVELGPRQGEFYPVIKGLNRGDKVAAAGGFLIDAETRLNPAAASTYFGASGGPQSNGRPSAPSAPSPRQSDQAPINPAKPNQPPAGAPVRPKPEPRVAVTAPEPDDLQNIAQLPAADRKLALAQRICPVTGAALGSMGVPVKITLRGQTVFLCCEGCVGKAKRSPDEMLKKLAEAALASRR
jgi:Cu(I)/Ag(I) efflux system membrane fusion protein